MNKKYLVPLMVLALCVAPVLAEVTYQEDADSFYYSGFPSITNTSFWDGNWSNGHVLTVGGDFYYYSNYTKPQYAISNETIWDKKYGHSTYGEYTEIQSNETIPESCFDADEEVLMLRFYTKSEYGNGGCYFWSHCYNGTDWQQLMYWHEEVSPLCVPLEEGVYWSLGEPEVPEEEPYDPATSSVLALVPLMASLGVIGLIVRKGITEGFTVENMITIGIVAVVGVSLITLLV